MLKEADLNYISVIFNLRFHFYSTIETTEAVIHHLAKSWFLLLNAKES